MWICVNNISNFVSAVGFSSVIKVMIRNIRIFVNDFSNRASAVGLCLMIKWLNLCVDIIFTKFSRTCETFFISLTEIEIFYLLLIYYLFGVMSASLINIKSLQFVLKILDKYPPPHFNFSLLFVFSLLHNPLLPLSLRMILVPLLRCFVLG